MMNLGQRYIELNPVRAAMVDDPAHYRWSSYRANGLGQADTLLTPHALYRSLGDSDKERRSAYRALFRAQLDRAVIDDIRLFPKNGARCLLIRRLAGSVLRLVEK